MKIYIETYGCASNQNDSQIMAGILNKEGFEIVNSIENSDIIILNTCIVKSVTENKIIYRIKELQKEHKNKKLIIAGCMPEAELETLKKIAPNINFVSTNFVTNIARVVKKTINNKNIGIVGKNKKSKLNLPKIRKNPIIDILEICSGCSYACSYCITKLAKGNLFSYPYKDIVKEICLTNDCKEFWITGQNIAEYNYDGINLPKLLKEMTNMKKEYFLRLGMMNPKSILPILDDLIKVYKNEHIFKFLHLPVQSGSDEILRLMNRNYSVKEFRKIVNEFRKNIPELTLWTDIIVGFPDEDKANFQKTIELVKEIKPDFTNISKFGIRPRTEAAKMKQLPTQIKKERSRIMTKVVDEISFEKNKKWLSWQGKILIDEKGRKKNQWVGRNFAYKPVLIKSKRNLFGKFVKVKIINTKMTHLVGELIK